MLRYSRLNAVGCVGSSWFHSSRYQTTPSKFGQRSLTKSGIDMRCHPSHRACRICQALRATSAVPSKCGAGV